MKYLLLIFCFFIFIVNARSQDKELSFGIVTQKTQKLYWENGLGADFTSGRLFNKRLHVKAAYVTSMLGSAIGSNAIKQGSFTIGADWRFRKLKPLQIFSGINMGYFHSNLEEDLFKNIPHNSILLQLESGMVYRLNVPLSVALSAGYNLISGDGINKPGTLFPLFYQLKVFYKLKK